MPVFITLGSTRTIVWDPARRELASDESENRKAIGAEILGEVVTTLLFRPISSGETARVVMPANQVASRVTATLDPEIGSWIVVTW